MVAVDISVVVLTSSALILSAILLVVTRLLSSNETNEVLEKSYESGEETIGTSIGIMSEYFHYFAIFIVFVFIGCVIIIWSAISRTLSIETSSVIIGVAMFGFALAYFVFKVGSGKD